MTTTCMIPKSVASLKTIVSALEEQFMAKPEAINTDNIHHFFALKAKVKRGTN